jgi:two-component system chemotaxis response regulator CheY
MARQRRVVLVVEDHPPLRDAIRRLLRQMELEPFEAADIASATALLSEIVPDLVCLDLVLPEGSGYELCELIRATPRLHDTPILAMSERAYPSDRAQAAEAGADAFLAKPFTAGELKRRIELLLEPRPAKALAS